MKRLVAVVGLLFAGCGAPKMANPIYDELAMRGMAPPISAQPQMSDAFGPIAASPQSMIPESPYGPVQIQNPPGSLQASPENFPKFIHSVRGPGPVTRKEARDLWKQYQDDYTAQFDRYLKLTGGAQNVEQASTAFLRRPGQVEEDLALGEQRRASADTERSRKAKLDKETSLLGLPGADKSPSMRERALTLKEQLDAIAKKYNPNSDNWYDTKLEQKLEDARTGKVTKDGPVIDQKLAEEDHRKYWQARREFFALLSDDAASRAAGQAAPATQPAAATPVAPVEASNSGYEDGKVYEEGGQPFAWVGGQKVPVVKTSEGKYRRK